MAEFEMSAVGTLPASDVVLAALIA